MFLKNKSKAFTLVELIVVITILAILGTIAFISLQGYARDARNSTRVSDINSMKKVLELYSLKESFYPAPDKSFIVSYNGDLLRNQGYFEENVTKNLGKLISKLPKDPLTKQSYIYSVANNNIEYELLTIYEGNYLGNNEVIVNSVYADQNFSPQISGTYNGIFIQTPNYFVPVPSIINSEIGEAELILSNENIKSQVVSGGDNLPGDSDEVDSQIEQLQDLDLITVDISTGDIADHQDDIITAIQDSFSGVQLELDSDVDKILTQIENGDGDDIFNTVVLNNPGNPNSDNSEEIITEVICPGLIGEVDERGVDYMKEDVGYYNDFDLCSNQKIITDINNIPLDTNLTNNNGGRSIYKINLTIGNTYGFESLGDDDGSDTVFFLYDNKGNLLTYNDDIDNNIFRSAFTFEATYTGEFLLGVMGYNDDGISDDYQLEIFQYGSCNEGTKPEGNYDFITGLPLVENQTYTKGADSCGYSCKSGFTGSDCEEELLICNNMTDTQVDNLNNTLIINQNNIAYLDFKNYVYNFIPTTIAAMVPGYAWDIPDTDISNPKTKEQWCELTGLKFNWTDLSSLPPELGYLQNLETINIQNTQIGTLPDEILNIANLKYLILLSNNNLGSLPDEIGNLENLEWIDIRWTNISILPTSVTKLNKLVDLNLNGTNIPELNTSHFTNYSPFISAGGFTIEGNWETIDINLAL